MRIVTSQYRLCLSITVLLMLTSACGLLPTGNPNVAAKAAFEKWAQQVGVPYKDVSYQTAQNDGTFATVRVQATMKESKTEDWLEKMADIECRHIGSEWQCSSSFVFVLTEVARDRQMQIAASTATAAAIRLQATATEQSRQAEATRQVLIATQEVLKQNANATATAIALGATATALAPRPTQSPATTIPFRSPSSPNILNPVWGWQPGGSLGNAYNVGSDSTLLTLTADAGTDHFHRVESAPLLLYPLKGNFEIQVKASFKPNQYYQLVGLGVRSTQDRYTWLRIAKYLTHEGQYIFFFATKQGTTSEVKYGPYSSNVVHFRIERIGDLFTLSFSPDAVSWITVQRDFAFGTPDALEAFLVVYSAHNSQRITAEFSDFRVSER